jgi:hypothetical protein
LAGGVPDFERILGKAPDLNAVRSIFRAVLLQHPNVEEVLEITFDLTSSRELKNVRIRVKATRGVIALNVPVLVQTEGEL